MSKESTVKGVVAVYAENLVSMVGGYVFWFVISKIATPEVVGISSALISLTTILSVIASMSIPAGIQRFIGKTYLNQKISNSKKYSQAAFMLLFLGIIASSVVIFLAHNQIFGTHIDSRLLIISIVLISSSTIMSLLHSIIISSLARTKTLPFVAIMSTIVKIIIGAGMVMFGFSAIGVTTGFTAAPVLGSIIFGVVVTKILRSSIKSATVTLKQCWKDILSASLSSWAPSVVYTVGSHLGTLIVFGSNGAIEAAIYFISLSIVTAIMTLMSALYSVSYSVLSAMSDGRKKHASRVMKISLLLSVTPSCAVLFYSNNLLFLFGHIYAEGTVSLQILLLSVLPMTITAGVTTLAYAYGKYRYVLILGLASNLPRPILYILLVPLFDATGAAMSYTIGSIVGLIVTIVISKGMSFSIDWRHVLLTFSIPLTLGFLLSYFHVNYVVGILSCILISWLLLIRLHVLNRADVDDLTSILPNKIASPILRFVDFIGKRK